jgi:hypothetical protein
MRSAGELAGHWVEWENTGQPNFSSSQNERLWNQRRSSFAEDFMHEISGVPGPELFQQIGPMEIDGTRSDAKCPSDLLAGGAPNDLSQRNTFFGSQSLMPGERFRQDVQRTI